MNEIFPNAEVRGFTVWQQLGHRWARLLHRIGIHDNVWTYRMGVDLADGFEERPLTLGEDGRIYKAEAAVLVRQLECSICRRPTGPIHIVGAA